MTAFPKNPFRPGAGLPPAYKGRRPEVEDTLSRLLGRLRDGDRGGEMAFLYGPRGNGKTVLLRWLHAEAAAAEVATVSLLPEHLESAAALAGAIRTATERFPGLGKTLSGLHVEVAGVKFGADMSDKSLPILAEVLNRGDSGILVTLDEAHEVPPQMLGRLLNAVQGAGEKRPVAVVLAGTPGLEPTLLKMRASFWSRGEQLPIGLLSDDSARDALARPFKDAGLETDDGAVAELAAVADNYPYFLQLYGRAAWQVVEESGGRTLLPEHVASAVAAENGPRQRYYGVRYEEFLEAELLPLARRVAEAFVDSANDPADRRLSNAALNELLAYEGGYDHRTFLLAKGYVWKDSPEDRFLRPGIPSLMDFMLEEIPAA